MEVTSKPGRPEALPTVSIKESWRDVWFCLRKPLSLEISAKAASMAGLEVRYWQLSAVQDRAPSWFLPRWLDRGHVVLTYRSGKEEYQRSFVLRGAARAQARKDILQRAHRELTRALDAADRALVPIRSDIERTYRSDRYVRHSQAARITSNHADMARKVAPVLDALHRHPLLAPSDRSWPGR